MSPLATIIIPWLAIAALPSSRDGNVATSTTTALAFLPPLPVAVVPHHRRRRPLRRPPADGNDDVARAPDRERRMRRRPNAGGGPPHRTPPISAVGDDDDDDVGGRGRGGGEDPRLAAMRSILESSWDASSMGGVPSDPASAARSAAECVSSAMSSNRNVAIVDLRLPTYDVLEGRRAYDAVAVYDFGVALSGEMRERGLARKCLILARNGGEVDEIRRGVEFRRRWGGGTTKTAAASPPLLSSPSHRLWSTVGRDLDGIVSGGGIGGLGPDAFGRIVSAVDANARLAPDEDALVILSPFDATDVVALRRILARYGRSRTIVIFNPRFEAEPREMDDAVLVYGMLPLVAASRNAGAGGGGRGGSGEGGGELRAVVMKRFPREWAVYVDVYGEGFVEAEGGVETRRDEGGGGGSEGRFPSPEWIARRVQSHVERLSRRRDV
jgi:hypothetical protein